MTVDEGSQTRALIVYQSSMGREFDIDSRDDTSDRGLKPIEELVQLQLGPKSGKCTRLNWDLTNHEHRCIPDVLHRNADLFTWSLSDMSGIHPDIIYHKLAICPRPNLYHRRKGKPERSGVKSSKKKSTSSSMQTSSERLDFLPNSPMSASSKRPMENVHRLH